MSAFLKRHGFTLALAAGMIAFELAMMLLLQFGQPNGNRWLGNTLLFPNDAAVYLAEIGQGEFLIRNPYAVEPHALRFDPVWSTLSVIHGLTGASPLLLHELARYAFTIALAFALHAAARSVADTEVNARFGTLLMVGGVGLGWLHAIFLGVFGLWSQTVVAAPDLVKELAVVPTLLGGAHMILSFTLLVTVVHGIWKAVHDRTRATWGICAGIVLLTGFHPYFIPLVLSVIGMAWTKKLGRRPAHERTHKPAIAFFLSLVPTTAYYIYLLLDPVFGQHHLVANHVLIGSIDQWIFTLGPAIYALIWMARRHHQEVRFLAVARWCLAWLLIIAALLTLPVPWHGKFVEALMVPLVLLTLPAWTAFFRWLPKPSSTALLVFVVAATPLFLLCSHVAWLRDPVKSELLGRPTVIFDAWDFLRSRPHAIVIADDIQVNVWTPAWSGATAWVGHWNETPGFTIKRAKWETLFTTQEADIAKQIVAESGATHLLLSSSTAAERMRSLLGTEWTTVFQKETTVILERK